MSDQSPTEGEKGVVGNKLLIEAILGEMRKMLDDKME